MLHELLKLLDFLNAKLTFNCGHRFHLSEDGEWLVKELGLNVERDEDGTVSREELRRISKLAGQK